MQRLRLSKRIYSQENLLTAPAGAKANATRSGRCYSKTGSCIVGTAIQKWGLGVGGAIQTTVVRPFALYRTRFLIAPRVRVLFNHKAETRVTDTLRWLFCLHRLCNIAMCLRLLRVLFVLLWLEPYVCRQAECHGHRRTCLFFEADDVQMCTEVFIFLILFTRRQHKRQTQATAHKCTHKRQHK